MKQPLDFGTRVKNPSIWWEELSASWGCSKDQMEQNPLSSVPAAASMYSKMLLYCSLCLTCSWGLKNKHEACRRKTQTAAAVEK